MRTLFLRWHMSGPGLVAGLVVALLLLSPVCPILMLQSCAGGQQTCPSQSCWLLVLGPSLPAVATFAWVGWAARGTPAQAYPLPLFRPPRPLPRLLA
jgi:hypothetical protein